MIAFQTPGSSSSANPRTRSMNAPADALARHGGAPRVVDQPLALDRRQQLAGPGHEPLAELVVVEHPDEAGAARVADHHGVVGGDREAAGPSASTSTRSSCSPPLWTWRTINGTGQVVGSSGADGQEPALVEHQLVAVARRR